MWKREKKIELEFPSTKPGDTCTSVLFFWRRGEEAIAIWVLSSSFLFLSHSHRNQEWRTWPAKELGLLECGGEVSRSPLCAEGGLVGILEEGILLGLVLSSFFPLFSSSLQKHSLNGEVEKRGLSGLFAAFWKKTVEAVVRHLLLS